MIANMMSIDNRISSLNKKILIEDRICTVIGDKKLKLCNNFLNQLYKVCKITKTNNKKQITMHHKQEKEQHAFKACTECILSNQTKLKLQ